MKYLIELISKIQIYKAILMQNMEHGAKEDYQIFKYFINNLKSEISMDNKSSIYILDIGTGRLCPFSLMLHHMGFNVTGIDKVYIGLGELYVKKLYKTLIYDGIEALLRLLSYSILLKNRKYYKTLQKYDVINQKSFNQIDIRRMNVYDMYFNNKMFDIVISIDVFEHLDDIPKALSEINRVMKNGGYLYLQIHPFSTISGCHNNYWKNFKTYKPWAHLYNNKTSIFQNMLNKDLNKIRRYDYISFVKEKFKICKVIDWDLDMDKKRVKKILYSLEEDKLCDLSNYLEKELIYSRLIILAKKCNFV